MSAECENKELMGNSVKGYGHCSHVNACQFATDVLNIGEGIIISDEQQRIVFLTNVET